MRVGKGGRSSCQRDPSSAAEIGANNGCGGGRGVVRMLLCAEPASYGDATMTQQTDG